MNKKNFVLSIALCLVIVFSSITSAAAKKPPVAPTAILLTSGLASGSGSTIGPDGALYVTEGIAGRVSRVDPRTGDRTTFASGLPLMNPAIGIGGAMDIAFIHRTAYVLVTLVGSDVGGSDVVGIYRVDGPSSFTVIADIGQWAIDNPPDTDYFVPTGVQYAMQPYKDGFLVTDGHHNRVLRVRLNGEVSELVAFDNIVPTGLALSGDKVYMAQAGPVPHNPEAGKVVSFKTKHPNPVDVASGAPLLVDVEFGSGRTLYALSQGHFSGGDPGSPADPDTGSLVKVNKNGTFTVVVGGLDRPTSLEIMGNNAYVVTLDGEIWKIVGIQDNH
jgi:hypothetical protein